MAVLNLTMNILRDIRIEILLWKIRKLDKKIWIPFDKKYPNNLISPFAGRKNSEKIMRDKYSTLVE